MGRPEQEFVDWIDEADRTIASLPRPEIRRRNLLHRVTATFVFHPDGRLMVHRRTDSKDVFPGYHDVCVGGTVESGETFTGNACREIGEELGVRGVPVYRLFGHRFRNQQANNLIEVFACEYAGPFAFQPEEIAEGFWADPDEADALVAAGRVCPDSSAGWRLYREQCRREGPFAERLARGALRPIPCGEPAP